MANIAVFDLDGVILASPSRESVPDPNYWWEFWSDISRHTPHMEILELINALIKQKIHILILTARPVSLQGITQDSLKEVCHLTPVVCIDPAKHHFGWTTFLHLMMREADYTFEDFSNNAYWKRKVIQALQIHHHVLFAVDDYKLNTEEMRKVVPVLLYEQLRGD